MTNEYYTPSGTPSQGSQLQSSPMRTEYNSIETAFGKLPAMTGNGSELVQVNAGGTALESIEAGAKIAAATEKTTPVDADVIPISDSAASSVLKKLTFANLWVWVQSKLNFGTGVATFLTTPSSANLASAITDETGSGALVFATNPTLTTPNIGTPSAGVLTNCSGTAASLTAGGNALLAGSSSQAFSASKFLGNTTTAYEAESGTVTQFNGHGNSATTDNGVCLINWRNSTLLHATVDFGKSKSSAIGTYAAVATGETLGKIRFFGSGASAFAQGAQIRAKVTEATPSNTVMGTKLEFLTSPDGSATPAVAVTIDHDKSLTGENAIVSKSATAGIGYTTGAGGSVTQGTSITTAVTLNKVCGRIACYAGTYNANTQTEFTVNNTSMAGNDVVVINENGSTEGLVITANAGTNAFIVAIRNVTAGNISPGGGLVLNFAIIKTVAS